MNGGEQVVDVAAVRRWVRRRQAAHRDRGSTLGTLYVAGLLAAALTGLLWPTVRAIGWPVTQSMSAWTAAGAALICLGGLLRGARRLGPLTLSRPAASWLLTAPVDRRALLLPSLVAAAAAATGLGALAAAGLTGQVAARPVTPAQLAVAMAFGALLGAGALLVAYAGQAGGRWTDQLAYPLVGLGLAGMLAGGSAPARQFAGDLLLDPPVLLAAGAAAALVGLLAVRTVRKLAATGNDTILEASNTAGMLFDSAYAAEPSFITAMVERRYWSRRRLGSAPFPTRLPVLIAQDLRLVRRRPKRLISMAALATVPVLAADGPRWLLPTVVLFGGVAAAATTAGAMRADAGNPALLRLLAVSSRQVVAARAWVPGMLAAGWSAVALLIVAGFGDVPPGPWWALGLALGPVGVVTAARRARMGLVQHGLLPVETPMGTVATGPVLAAIGGVDALLLGVPAVLALVDGTPLTWTEVLVQALVGVAGAVVYLRASTSSERTALAAG